MTKKKKTNSISGRDKEITYKDLTAKESEGLGKQIFLQALELKKDAAVLATQRNRYSSATSLLVLSLEEIIKAIVVEIHAQGYPIYKITFFNEVMRKHTSRHQFAELIEPIYTFGMIILNYKWLSQKKYLDDIKKVLNKFNHETKEKDATLIVDIIASFFLERDFKEFNNYKNAGFYTDYRDQLKLPNQEFSKIHYENVEWVHDVFQKVFKLILLSKYQDVKNTRISEILPSVRELVDHFCQNDNVNEILEQYKNINC